MTHNRKSRQQSLTVNYTGFQKEVLAYLNDLQDGQKKLAMMIGRSFQGITQSVDDLGELVMKEVDDLNVELEGIETVGDGLIVVTDRIFAMLQDALPSSAQNAELKAAIATVTSRLKAQKEETAAALLRNTPQDPGGSTGGVGGSTGGV